MDAMSKQTDKPDGNPTVADMDKQPASKTEGVTEERGVYGPILLGLFPGVTETYWKQKQQNAKED